MARDRLQWIRYCCCVCFQFLIVGNIIPVKAAFTYEYMDSEFNVLRLGCNGDCSVENQASTIMQIVIYNSSSLVALVRTGQGPIPGVSPLEAAGFYVGGALTPDHKFCSLEVVINKCKMFKNLEFQCKIVRSDRTGEMITTTTDLVVDKKVPQETAPSLSTNIHVIFIVVIVILFLLTVCFLSLWIQARCCRGRKNVVYETPSQSEIVHNHQSYNSQGPYEGPGSMLSVTKSASRLSIRKDSEGRLPGMHGSVRRVTSKSDSNLHAHRAMTLPQPPAPPPKFYLREQSQNSRNYDDRSVKVPYSLPQDALEADFSEDGDVATGSDEHLKGRSWPPGSRPGRQKAGLYSCVPINSVDV